VAVLEHLLAELDLTLGLIGCSSLSDLTEDLVVDARGPMSS
jgi:isopentenyl diphosphate isomerase/L-lactate dehydrogenase-like FMN-dependent dehydrogenase